MDDFTTLFAYTRPEVPEGHTPQDVSHSREDAIRAAAVTLARTIVENTPDSADRADCLAALGTLVRDAYGLIVQSTPIVP